MLAHRLSFDQVAPGPTLLDKWKVDSLDLRLARSSSEDKIVFYFDLLHDHPDMGGVVQFSRVLFRALRDRLGDRLIPISSLRDGSSTRTSMDAFTQEGVFARALAARYPAATFLFPHFHSPLAGRRPRQRVINIVHDVQFKSCPDLYCAEDLLALDEAHRQTRARADDILFVSRVSRDDFIRHFGAPRSFAVIGAPVEARPQTRPFGGAPYLLATSHNSHHPHKNLQGLMALFARLADTVPDLLLRITGFGAEIVEAEVRQLPAGLRERVHHHGFVTRAALDSLYTGAYAFASLSRCEGFNLSAAEAAVHKVPLLLSDIPVHRELFGELALFVTPATPVDVILGYIARRRTDPWAWAHEALCTPQSVAKAVLDRIEGANRGSVTATLPARRPAGRLRTLLLSSLAGSVLLGSPTFAQTVLTQGGTGGGGAAGGTYGQNGSDATAGSNGGGGGGGPSLTPTAGGAGDNNGGAGGGGGAVGGNASISFAGGLPDTANGTGGTGANGVAGTGIGGGGGGGAGGYGVVFEFPANATATFTHTGGNGGAGGSSGLSYVYYGQGGGGGGGILLLQGGTITNASSGSLIGGAGGSGYAAGNGGAGLETSESGPQTFTATVNNSGIITGGPGGRAIDGSSTQPPGTPGVGGAGVALVGGGTVNNINNGAITGGAGGVSGATSSNGANYFGFGGNGGSGIDLYAGGTLSNGFAGIITGGAGAAGVTGQAPAVPGLPLNGTNGGNGGAGVKLIGGALTFSSANLGQIVGGSGGAGGGLSQQNGAGGYGGDAISVIGSSNATTIANGGSGILQGGAGGNAGVGVVPGAAFSGSVGGNGGRGLNASLTTNLLTFTNASGGRVSGGDGGTGGNGAGAGYFGNLGGSGGAGAVFFTVPTFTNAGTINGGVGGAGGAGYNGATAGNGGTGGDGVEFLAAGVRVTNTGGSIIGGDGGAGGLGINGSSNADPGIGGSGLVGSGLTIENTGGTIRGGLDGAGNNQAFAVVFTGGVNSISTGGTISGGILVNGGSFQPALNGSPVGTPLAISGPLTFNLGTIYNVRITPQAADSVAVSGVATIVQDTHRAAVNVVAGAGTYTTRRYTIISATGGVVGTFSGVTTNLAFLLPTLSYDPNNVYLSITGNAAAASGSGGGGTGTGAGINYATAAVTLNQIAVANGLTNASDMNGNSGRLFRGLNQLTASQAQAAFDTLSGEGVMATQDLAHRANELFTSSIFDQTTFYGADRGTSITLTAPASGSGYTALASVKDSSASGRELGDLPDSHIEPTFVAPTRTWRVWGTGYGASETIHGNTLPVGSATQDNSLYGGVLGIDYQLTPNYLVGIALGGSDGEFSVPGRATYGSTTGGQIGLYDIVRFGAFYGASSTSFSYFTNTTTRDVAGFGGLPSEIERGSFASHEFRSRLEFGREAAGMFGLSGTITPFVALEIADLRANGFGEQTVAGGPGVFALNVSGQSTADVPAFLGLRLRTAMAVSGMSFSPSLQVAYVHEFAPYRQQTAAIADLPGSTFLIDGARPGRDGAQVKAGGEFAIGPATAFFANFDGEFSGSNELYAGKAGLKCLF